MERPRVPCCSLCTLVCFAMPTEQVQWLAVLWIAKWQTDGVLAWG